VKDIIQQLKVSERRACKVLGQPVSTQRHVFKVKSDEDALRSRIIELATQYGRYGYRMITDLLKTEGWRINHKRVERIWRQEGLKVPQKQPKRKRLWLNDGSCIRLRAMHKNHVWSYDFVHERTHDGRALKILTIMDEYTRESLAINVSRKLKSQQVIEQLADLFITRGTPDYIRSDNGPEFTAKAVIEWLASLDVTTLFIEPGSPWENGYIESFNGTLRYELLNGEIFMTLKEAQVIIESWRQQYNQIRPHSSLGGRAPVPEAYKTYQFQVNSNLTTVRY